ncbi:hypothetical protein [Parafrankia discariae]|uniref:hypothetical protein n=1 Tax=Parafrankia discariae TaxID=365528 RepID=UPI00036CE256|nr:hypothetical protein [Parafrankia discariae]
MRHRKDGGDWRSEPTGVTPLLRVFVSRRAVRLTGGVAVPRALDTAELAELAGLLAAEPSGPSPAEAARPGEPVRTSRVTRRVRVTRLVNVTAAG